MEITQDLTLVEVARRLSRCGGKLHLYYEHGVYHAYVHDQKRLGAYSRGDLAEAIDVATQQAQHQPIAP